MKCTSFIVVLALATAMPLVAVNRANASNTEQRQVIVSYADLNPSTVAGAMTLYRRIHGAAEQVCVDYQGRDLEELTSYHRCLQESIDRAVETVHWATLSALNAKHKSRSRFG